MLSHQHMENNDRMDYYIKLIKEYKVADKKHLLAWEQLWINKMKSNNINFAFDPTRICYHKRLRAKCTSCKGKLVCQHEKLKRICPVCFEEKIGGASRCCHNKEANSCKECKGPARCKEHNKIKNSCKECNGKYICPHDKIFRQCRECKDVGGGKALCPHERQRSKCRECGGGAICPHDKQKYTCKLCSPVICDLCDGKIFSKNTIRDHNKRFHS